MLKKTAAFLLPGIPYALYALGLARFLTLWTHDSPPEEHLTQVIVLPMLGLLMEIFLRLDRLQPQQNHFTLELDSSGLEVLACINGAHVRRFTKDQFPALAPWAQGVANALRCPVTCQTWETMALLEELVVKSGMRPNRLSLPAA